MTRWEPLNVSRGSKKAFALQPEKVCTVITIKECTRRSVQISKVTETWRGTSKTFCSCAVLAATTSGIGMLNEVWIFELCFSYSYTDVGNLTFACKSAEGVDSRRCVVYRVGWLLVSRHLRQWAGGGVGGTAAVMQWQDNMKWLHPRGVMDGLITAGMRCLAATRVVWRTCFQQHDPW